MLSNFTFTNIFLLVMISVFSSCIVDYFENDIIKIYLDIKHLNKNRFIHNVTVVRLSWCHLAPLKCVVSLKKFVKFAVGFPDDFNINLMYRRNFSD